MAKICDKCKKPISEASTKRIQIRDTDNHFASPEDKFHPVSGLDLCTECAYQIADKIVELVRNTET